jgi:adenosylmethionine-8-amino-7-oxononanoate aminotransferase
MTPREKANLLALDKEYLWHPFTPMGPWCDDEREEGRVIVAGEGFELIDDGGRRYIDGFGSLWCNLHGHRVEAIDAAVRAQLEKIAHSTLLGHAQEQSVRLAKRLVDITPPNLKKCFFSDSGATATEIALKMAYQFFHNRGERGRRKFIALDHGYHGDTIGSMAVGGVEAFHSIYRPMLFETTFVDCPNPYHHPEGDRGGEIALERMGRALAAEPEAYCGVILEPLIQGAGGMLTHPPGFLRSVREMTDRHGVLLIADEVATGFCRTGRLFACEHEGVQPDLLCLGKGLTGGYLPVAATLTTQELYDGFLGGREKVFYHGHTFTGNALGCAAANASVDLIFADGLLDALSGKVQLVRDKLSPLSEHPHVGDIRQCGMMVGIELVAERPKTPFDPTRRVGAKVCDAARRHGVIIRPLGDVVVLMPAPGMDRATLERLLDVTVETIREFFA